MRLFAALPLDNACKAALNAVCAALRQRSARASLTRPELMHLTLAFIGEVPADESGAVKTALSGVMANAFPFEIVGVGRFRRDDGDIVWAGLRQSAALEALAAETRGALQTAGFAIDTKPFRPHLTLARRVRFATLGDYDAFAAAYSGDKVLCTTRADRFTLMESRRTDGRLDYAELADYPLK